MKAVLKTVTLVGRPNCGKSSIWNRLVKSENEGRAALMKGKARKDSSLLTGIVNAKAGTTRDVREGFATLGDLRFKIVDSGGLEERGEEEEEERFVVESMMARTVEQMRNSDVVLFCLDATAGVTREDEHYARWLRRRLFSSSTTRREVVVVANKVDAADGILADDRALVSFAADCARLGFGDPVLFSALPREQGLGDLHHALSRSFGVLERGEEEEEREMGPAGDSTPGTVALVGGTPPSSSTEQRLEGATRVVRLAVIGKPNAGKSTLLNALMGRERFVVGSQPGTTRDAVWHDVHIPHASPRGEGEEKGGWTTVRLIDTAGVSRKAMSALRVGGRGDGGSKTSSSEAALDRALETASVEKSLAAIRAADVVALVIDLGELDQHAGDKRKPPGMSRHDLALAGRVADEGKPLVLLANKLDRIAVLEPSAEKESELNAVGERKLREWVREELRDGMPVLKEAPVLLVSAATGRNLDRVLPTALALDSRWSRRIATPRLNRWLQLATGETPPPLANVVRFFGRRRAPGVAPVRLKFLTQVSVRPPTFAVWCNRPRELSESYKSYLKNRLRADFGLEGVPIRLVVRASENPYADRPTGSRGAAAIGPGGEGKQRRGMLASGSGSSRTITKSLEE